jgi:hypothetical protein
VYFFLILKLQFILKLSSTILLPSRTERVQNLAGRVFGLELCLNSYHKCLVLATVCLQLLFARPLFPYAFKRGIVASSASYYFSSPTTRESRRSADAAYRPAFMPPNHVVVVNVTSFDSIACRSSVRHDDTILPINHVYLSSAATTSL